MNEYLERSSRRVVHVSVPVAQKNATLVIGVPHLTGFIAVLVVVIVGETTAGEIVQTVDPAARQFRSSSFTFLAT